MLNKAISVEELNGYIRSIFRAEEMLFNINVYGEISGYSVSGAHAYFTVKGQNAAIPCTCFSYVRTYKPRNGESVLLKGTPDFYSKTGKLSFNVESIQPIGLGELHVQLEMLKVKLEEEGLFLQQHKKAIPQFPKSVCVITSKTGAVIRDIIMTIRKNNSLIDIYVYNVKVQGVDAAEQVSAAIKAVDNKFDAIIVARGGGSFEDLAPFNTEIVVRSVFNANTPIISAIGHETDYSLCDFVADARALTPTAAASFVAYDEVYYKTQIIQNMASVAKFVQNLYKYSIENLINNTSKLRSSMERIVSKNGNMLQKKIDLLFSVSNKFVMVKQHLFERKVIALGSNNPCVILTKGYFSLNKEGKHINKIAQLSVGDNITLLGIDGKATLQVRHREINNETGTDIKTN